jgi:hypothetical protein
MCSNLVHFLDLYTYLTDEVKELELKCDKLFESKRSKYYDMFGTVKSTDNIIEIINSEEQNLLIKEIETDKLKIKIINKCNSLEIIDKDQNNIILNYTIPYLSTYMSSVIIDILLRGSCDLTPYDESMKIHLQVLNLFTEEFKKHNINTCQIT